MTQTAQQVTALQGDARNRALRSFLQGLGIDVLVAVCLVVLEATNAHSIDWRIMAASLLRSVAQAAASYIMRRFIDPSRIPSPLPPDPVPEPAE